MVLLSLVFHDISAWWILACIATGGGYAFLLYRKDVSLSPTIRKAVGVCRAVSVALITLLLCAPLFKTVTQQKEKPIIVLALDQSASMGMFGGLQIYRKELPEIFKRFSDKFEGDFEVQSLGFASQITDKISFLPTTKQTDLSALFKEIGLRYANRNLGAVVLFSDGIYNKGGNPIYEVDRVKAPIYTVAMGSAVQQKDIVLTNINYNKVAYLGNDYQIELVVEAKQLANNKAKLQVMSGQEVLFTKDLVVSSNDFRIKIPVILHADKEGLKQIKATISSLPGEISLQNNQQTVFVEVLNAKEKVLILAKCPHPDITAIRQSIEANQNYEVQVAFEDNFSELNLAKYNLIILHQMPTQGSLSKVLKMRELHIPLLFMLGAQSDIPAFNQSQNILNITSNGTLQEVLPTLRNDFYGFTLTEYSKDKIAKYAPLKTFFGNVHINGQHEAVMNQRIGIVETDNPLCTFGDLAQTKIGILLGEGLWRWRMEDYQENKSHDAIEELLSKVVRFLVSKSDKRKFKVSPNQSSFDELDEVLFNAELYNDAYELINTPDVTIDVTDAHQKTYKFLCSRTSNAYELNAGILPPGIYTFIATSAIGDAKKYTVKGKFVVAQQNLEYSQTEADHKLLFALAKQTGGFMVDLKHFSQIEEGIKQNEQIKTITYEKKQYVELIDSSWILIFIIILLTIEWFVRKRNGLV